MDLKINKNYNWRICFAVAASCFFFLGAKNPRDILAPEEMAELLAELELAKAASNYNKAEDDAKIFFRMNETEIFAEYEISAEIFESSYNYYVDKPEKFLSIYNNVVMKLEAML